MAKIRQKPLFLQLFCLTFAVLEQFIYKIIAFCTVSSTFYPITDFLMIISSKRSLIV